MNFWIHADHIYVNTSTTCLFFILPKIFIKFKQRKLCEVT